MDRIAEIPAEEGDESPSDQHKEAVESKSETMEWDQHPLNLRLSLPLPFGRWYVTLIAGPERRRKERRIEEREKHSLETAPNLTFLLSIGFISSLLLILVTLLVLIHGFGWSIHLEIPA